MLLNTEKCSCNYFSVLLYNKDFDFLRYYHYSVRLRWRIRLGSQRFSIIRFINDCTLKLTSFQTGAIMCSILALFFNDSDQWGLILGLRFGKFSVL